MFEWDTDEIVFADGRDFDRVGEFEYGCVGMGVGGYDLFGGFGADGNDACEEIDHFDGVAALTVEKV